MYSNIWIFLTQYAVVMVGKWHGWVGTMPVGGSKGWGFWSLRAQKCFIRALEIQKYPLMIKVDKLYICFILVWCFSHQLNQCVQGLHEHFDSSKKDLMANSLVGPNS
jgi:hypothetical protein